MELITKYLKEKYTYQFWVADEKKEVFSVAIRFIKMEEYPVYMDCYKATISLNEKVLKSINYNARGWKKRSPMIVRENALGEITAFNMHWEGESDNGKGHSEIRCIAKLSKEE